MPTGVAHTFCWLAMPTNSPKGHWLRNSPISASTSRGPLGATVLSPTYDHSKDTTVAVVEHPAGTVKATAENQDRDETSKTLQTKRVARPMTLVTRGLDHQ